MKRVLTLSLYGASSNAGSLGSINEMYLNHIVNLDFFNLISVDDQVGLLMEDLHTEDSETTYLVSTYKKKTISFPGTPLCHSCTPIVTDVAIRQRIFENQVGRALDAMDDIAHLLSCFMRNFIFLQGKPNKNHQSGKYYNPHDQSWSRSS